MTVADLIDELLKYDGQCVAVIEPDGLLVRVDFTRVSYVAGKIVFSDTGRPNRRSAGTSTLLHPKPIERKNAMTKHYMAIDQYGQTEHGLEVTPWERPI
jgi:hypothetical protein